MRSAWRERLGEAVDRAAAPRRHRQARLLGQALGRDLVAEQPHGARVGADEDDAQALAELREVRMLGDEAPADPRGVGPVAMSASSSAPKSR